MTRFISESVGIAGHMVVRTEPSGLWAARRHISFVTRQLDLDDEEASDILLAVGEAISNAYMHGTPDTHGGFIYMDWCYAGDVFTVTVKDDGPGMPHEILGLRQGKARREYKLPTIRGRSRPGAGRGLQVMRASVDELRLEYDRGTRVVLKKRCNSPQPKCA